MNPKDAASVLACLEHLATDQERENRYQSQDRRMIEQVVDVTPCGSLGVPRLRLLVVMGYERFYEDKCRYSTGIVTCTKAGAKASLRYGCLRYPALQPIGLTRAQALDLLEVRELPIALWPADVAPVADDWDLDAFFVREASTVYGGRNRAGKPGTR